MTRAEPLRVAVVGCGGIANAHAAQYYSNSGPAVQLTACCDTDSSRAETFAARFGVPKTFAQLEDVVQADVCDAVDICTPPSLHTPLIKVAAEAGKDIICEKPFATSYQEAADAVAYAEAAGVSLGVMQNYRWRPEYIEARNAIVGGRIGSPTMAMLMALMHWDGGDNYRRRSERMLILELTCHYIDLLRFVTGRDIESVYAVAGRAPTSAARGETFTSITLTFEGGLLGSIWNSGECQGLAANWGGQAVVQGTEGTVYVNYPTPVRYGMYSGAAGGWAERIYPPDTYPINTNPPFSWPLTSYCQALLDGSDAPVTGRDNLGTIAAVFAAYRSAETGQPVMLSEISRSVTEPAAVGLKQ